MDLDIRVLLFTAASVLTSGLLFGPGAQFGEGSSSLLVLAA
jgi:hypothetical protein